MKHQKLQERIDKINLLKEISKGKKSIDDLVPETIRWWYCLDKDRLYSSGELKLTREAFEQYMQEYPNQRNIVYMLQEGNEPLIDQENR